MSTNDSGFGGKVGRSPEFESEFADRQNAAPAPGGQTWNADAANTQKSEVSFMVQGAGRPGQPNIGQRSIFGNGGPTFAQMPTYTPVTRGAEQPQAEPQAPYPPQTANPQPAAPTQPAAPAQPAPQAANPQPQPAYQPPQPQPQAYDAGYQGHQGQPQAYSAPSPAGGAPGAQDLPDLSDADPGFPESIFPDFKSADAGFPDPDYQSAPADQGVADASFPETGFGADAALGGGPDSGGHGVLSGADHTGGYPAAQDAGFAPQAPMPQQPAYQPQAYQPQAYQPEAYQPEAYQPQAPQAPQPQAPQPQQPQAAPSDPGRQLQAYDSVYDQPPQIALADASLGAEPQPQEYFEGERPDADFMDESQLAPPATGRSKLVNTLRGRSAFMVGSALLGAIALGGALAFAYKQSGGGSGDTPVVTADARPVKEAPDQPGGKEFPHKNKLIYDRLTNDNAPASERLVPRQEDVAVPALPSAGATAGLPAPVATTDLGNPATTQSVDGAAEDGGPRKVKTLVVRPDGSVEAPAAAAAANAAANAANGAAAAANDAAAQAAQAAQAATQPSNVMPVPAAQAAPAAEQQVAAADPAPAADDSKYVIQVSSQKSQTAALGTFADMKSKYASLLGGYSQPIVQRVNLGDKGTWYRLQLGPMEKDAAYKLCGQLKSKGHSDCLVMAQ